MKNKICLCALLVIIEDTVTIKVPHFSSDTDFKREHYGLIAQDVQKLFPQLVDEDGAGYLSVNYVELIPLLIQAVQELSAEVEKLSQKLILENNGSKKTNDHLILKQVVHE